MNLINYDKNLQLKESNFDFYENCITIYYDIK